MKNETENVKNPEAPAKRALTEEEKRAKRNAYSRAYYAAHKDKMIAAVRKCQAKHAKAGGAKKPRKVAKRAMKKPAGKAVKTDKALAKLLKAVERAQAAYDKSVEKTANLKAQLKEAKLAVKVQKAASKA